MPRQGGGQESQFAHLRDWSPGGRDKRAWGRGLPVSSGAEPGCNPKRVKESEGMEGVNRLEKPGADCTW